MELTHWPVAERREEVRGHCSPKNIIKTLFVYIMPPSAKVYFATPENLVLLRACLHGIRFK